MGAHDPIELHGARRSRQVDELHLTGHVLDARDGADLRVRQLAAPEPGRRQWKRGQPAGDSHL